MQARVKSSEVMRAANGVTLLRRVRDEAPSEEELLHWLGEAEAGRFHVLRKAGLLLVEEGRVIIGPEHRLDDDRVVWHGRSDSILWNVSTGEVQFGRSSGQRCF